MRQNLSPIAQTAYQDLLRSLKDETVSDIRGTPTRVERGARTYWYDTYRIGSEVRKSYIGEDTPELRERLEKNNAIAAEKEDSQRHRARMIRLLRAEGFSGVDVATGSLLNAMQKAGVFRLGGTIVGTQAFRLYEGELGVRFAFDQHAQTNDIDIASFERLSLALDDQVIEPLNQVFAGFSFEAMPSIDREKVWRWKQSRSELLLEFLTPSFDAEETLKPLPALGVYAQSLHYLNFLISDPLKVAIPYRNGILVQVPRPERFAIHKIIVADRRQTGEDSFKSRKDRAQAAALIEILAEDRPIDLLEAFEDAVSRGSRWKQRLTRSLERMPAALTVLNSIGAKF